MSEVVETGPATAETGGRVYKIEHKGEGGDFFLLNVVNLILTGLTLGIYTFWAKTRVRHYLWAHTEFDGEPFEYTGRGLELFLGALIVGLFLLPVLWFLGFGFEALLLSGQAVLAVVLQLSLFVGFFFLIGVAEYRARRYQMSRTRWRGIAMSLEGSTMKYAVGVFFRRILNVITLGFSTPYLDLYQAKQFLGGARFGSGSVTTNYNPKELYRSFLLAYGLAFLIMLIPIILLVPAYVELMTATVSGGAVGSLDSLEDAGATYQSGVFGSIEDLRATLQSIFFGTILLYIAIVVSVIPYSIYQARKWQYIAQRTMFEGLQFKFRATVKDWIWLYVGNVLLVIFTLGLGYPLVIMRSVRFGVGHLHCAGTINYAKIQQVEREEPSLGEGLADALDIGAI